MQRLCGVGGDGRRGCDSHVKCAHCVEMLEKYGPFRPGTTGIKYYEQLMQNVSVCRIYKAFVRKWMANERQEK